MHPLRKHASVLIICSLFAVVSIVGSASAARLITGQDIKNGSIKNKDVAEETLGLDRIKPNDVKKLVGPRGPAGPAGPGAGGSKVDGYVTWTWHHDGASVPSQSGPFTGESKFEVEGPARVEAISTVFSDPAAIKSFLQKECRPGSFVAGEAATIKLNDNFVAKESGLGFVTAVPAGQTLKFGAAGECVATLPPPNDANIMREPLPTFDVTTTYAITYLTPDGVRNVS